MPKTIVSRAKCAVIRFRHAEGCNADEINRRMRNVCGKTFMIDSKVRQWFRNFKAGRTDVHNSGVHGRKRGRTDDLVHRADQAI